VRHAIIGSGFGIDVHLPVFLDLPFVDVVAVVDNGSGKASRLSLPGVSAYSDWRRMLEVEKVDSISVVVPPASQAEIVLTALERGIHVLCEKPLGNDISQAKEILCACRSAGVVGAVSLQYRYEAGVEEFRHAIIRQKIGKLLHIDFNWLTSGRSNPSREWCWQHDLSMGGGVLNGFVSHLADLLYWLTGSEVQTVVGQTQIQIANRLDPIVKTHRKVTAEDWVNAVTVLESGVTSSLTASNCHPTGLGFSVKAEGDSGILQLIHRPPFNGDAELSFTGLDGYKILIPIHSTHSNSDSRVIPFGKLAKRFVNAIHECAESEYLPRFEDGLRVQKFLDALRVSDKSRTKVFLR